MKEFNLTQPYATLEEMMNSAEVAIYKEELQQGNIEQYAIVSRIGNRYDLNGNKVEDFAPNPFCHKEEVVEVEAPTEIKEEKETEETSMKYLEIEALIDKEIEKAVAEVNAKYEQELSALKEKHAQELATAKAEVKAELIAKLNA